MLPAPAMKQDTSNTSNPTSTIVPGLRHNEEQEAMNQWFRDLDHITVSRTSEKEGFLFKHINYEVESEKMGSKVLRRFSDFYWLWEVLLKRYQFRILPNLPPKKLGGSKVKKNHVYLLKKKKKETLK